MFLLLRRLLGCEVFLGDVFYLYFWLFERVVKMSDDMGVGFLIVLLVIEI